MSRGRLPLRSMEGARLPSWPDLSFSFSSFSSTLAASLLAFWDAFSSCLCSFIADFSCTEDMPESASPACGLCETLMQSELTMQHMLSKAHCHISLKVFPGTHAPLFP